MEKSSHFIKNKALFGSYPTQEQIDFFESIGVKYFVNLTFPNEKNITPYKTKYEYFVYSIPDKKMPTNWQTFAQFIIKLGEIIKNMDGEKMYIHCKGGHGRSGVVVAYLLCYLYKILTNEALNKTSIYHSNRKEMKEKWRKIGSPQTKCQKNFVTKFFEPLYIYGNYTKYFSTIFNNTNELYVQIPEFDLCFRYTPGLNSFNDFLIKEYYKLKIDIKEMEKLCTSKNNLENIKKNVLYLIINYKFNENIKKNLLKTGLRPIIIKSVDQSFDNFDLNIIGELIVKFRTELYKLKQVSFYNKCQNVI